MYALFFILSFLSLNFFTQNRVNLKVMSYNIRYDNPEDGKNQWAYRRETLTNYFIKNKPDIIGMQEVLHSQLMDLTSSLNEYQYVGVGREDGKTKGEYSPIVYLKSNLKMVKTSTFWLSQTPEKISVGWDAVLERICTYALFEDRKTKKQFWVFNTHFDHIGEIARAEAAKLIISQISKLNPKGLPTLITGDFNLTPDTKPIQIMQTAFNDVLQNLKSSESTYGTFTGFNTKKVAKRRIDYIFQKGVRVQQASHLWIKTPKGLWASDHHPVYLHCFF